MKRVIGVLSILLITGCISQQHKYKMNFKRAYIESYKLRYYTLLLKEGFNNSKAINEILGSDRYGGMSDFFLRTQEQTVVDSFIKIDSKKMVLDSLQSIDRRRVQRGKLFCIML